MEQELSFDPGHTKFTVPDGATPGSMHGVFLPGGYRAALTVPAGAKAGDELTFRCTIVDKEPQKAVITKPKEDTRIGLTLWSREETDPPLVTEIHPEGAAAGKVEVGDTLVRLSGPHRIKVVEVAEGGAAAGKVQTGDVLVTIDGKSFGPFGHEAATTFLKAAVGEVKVVVQRQGEAVEAAFTKDAPDTKTGIVLQGGPLDEPALGMYAATQQFGAQLSAQFGAQFCDREVRPSPQVRGDADSAVGGGRAHDRLSPRRAAARAARALLGVPRQAEPEDADGRERVADAVV